MIVNLLHFSRLATLLVLLSCQSLFAQDTLHIFSHRKEVIVTDPSEGMNHYPQWTVFPAIDEDIRAVKLRVHFACPDTMRCADWDYSDRIVLVKQGGVNSDTLNWELARLITPYGGFFNSDWNFYWENDLTDFSSVLRDSALISFIHTGYEPNHDRGWLLSLEFIFIIGAPKANPIAIHEIYNDHFVYGDSQLRIEQYLLPQKFRSSEKASFAQLRILQTGHGMDRPDNCAEFCKKYRELWFDGELIQKRDLWKTCGDNPLYPQAGTWIFDRANWCPGDLIPGENFWLTLKPDYEHEVFLYMEPYTTSGQNPGAQVISAYLIEYEKPTQEIDASITDIMVPSGKDSYSRLNPALANARIILANSGAQTINLLEIEYGTIGFPKNKFVWQGKIETWQSDTILLPGIIESVPGLNIFEVSIRKVNNQQDQYPADNSIQSMFNSSPIHESPLIFSLLTNNQPEQNSWYLVNLLNNEKLYESDRKLKTKHLYRDTFQLEQGSYQLVFNDTGGDGLEFWFNADGGRGEAQLLSTSNQLIKAFESDCGLGWSYSFRIGNNPDKIDSSKRSISLYPGRTFDKVEFRYFANSSADITVRLTQDPGGDLVEEHRYPNLKEGIFLYDLQKYNHGRFYLKVYAEEKEIYQKRIRFVDRPSEADLHPYQWPEDKKVKEKLEIWQDWKFGVIIHWGPYSQWGIVESWSLSPEDEPWCERKGPYADNYHEYVRAYEEIRNEFNPVLFNPDIWAAACNRAGMKYLVFTTKHHDGFCMYDSKFTDYTISNPKSIFSTNNRNNISNEVFTAFRKYNFGIGAYFSKADWNHKDYWWPYFPSLDRNVNYNPLKYPEKWENFKQFTHNQIDELMSDYGNIDILWLDGGWVRPEGSLTEETRPWLGKNGWIQDIDMDELAKNARKKQEGILIVDRTVHGPYENYRTPEQQIPNEYPGYPWESCITLGGGWYSSGPDDELKSSRWAIHTLIQIVAKGGNLLLGIGPDKTGALMPNVLKRLEEIGDWMDVNQQAIYETKALEPYQTGDFALTQSKDSQIVYLFYLIKESNSNIPARLILPDEFPLTEGKINLLGSETTFNIERYDNRLTIKIPSRVRKEFEDKPALVFRKMKN